MGRDAQRAQKTLEFEIGKKVEMLENLDDKYCAGEISKDNYDRISKRYKHEIKELKQKVEILTRNKKGIKKKIDYSLCIINNLTNIMRNGSVEMKIKVLSSMFPEKIEFDGEKYRTNSYNKVLDLIYQHTNELLGRENEKGEAVANFSNSVPLTVLFSNHFFEDLDKIWELRHWIPDPTKPILPPNKVQRTTV